MSPVRQWALARIARLTVRALTAAERELGETPPAHELTLARLCRQLAIILDSLSEVLGLEPESDQARARARQKMRDTLH